jgi:hypothetical protein
MYEDIFNNLEEEVKKLKDSENRRKELLKELNVKEREINIDFSYKYRALEDIYKRTYKNILIEHEKQLKENRDHFSNEIKTLSDNKENNL